MLLMYMANLPELDNCGHEKRLRFVKEKQAKRMATYVVATSLYIMQINTMRKCQNESLLYHNVFMCALCMHKVKRV